MAEKKKDSLHYDKEAADDETVGKRKKTFTLKRKKEASDINKGKEADEWFFRPFHHRRLLYRNEGCLSFSQPSL